MNSFAGVLHYLGESCNKKKEVVDEKCKSKVSVSEEAGKKTKYVCITNNVASKVDSTCADVSCAAEECGADYALTVADAKKLYVSLGKIFG